MRRVGTLLAAGLVLAVAAAVPATAGVPMDLVKGSVDRVLRLVLDPELKRPENLLERRKRIRTVADQLFDWQETGKRALARHWSGRTPPQRAEFSALFADLLERSYVGKIESYSGEKVLYTGESIDGELATVTTMLVSKAGTEISVDYRLQKEGDRWRVYDVLIEGVGLVGNYRTQFNRIIQKFGYDELIKRMKAKQDELVFDEAEKAKRKP
jgi:phospholipid transport system substrate-binding protein